MIFCRNKRGFSRFFTQYPPKTSLITALPLPFRLSTLWMEAGNSGHTNVCLSEYKPCSISRMPYFLLSVCTSVIHRGEAPKYIERVANSHHYSSTLTTHWIILSISDSPATTLCLHCSSNHDHLIIGSIIRSTLCLVHIHHLLQPPSLHPGGGHCQWMSTFLWACF